MDKFELEMKIESVIERVVSAETDDFIELVRLSGLDIQKDLIGTDLRGVDFQNLDLRLFDFSECDLREANFEGANLKRVAFENADLRNSNMRCANLEYSQLQGAKLNGADMTSAYLVDAVLSGASLEGAIIHDAKLVRESGIERIRSADIIEFSNPNKKIFADTVEEYHEKTKIILRQRTIKMSIHCSGIGLHSGQNVSMTLHPAEPDTGILFRRTDGDFQSVSVKATWANAVETPLCTTLVDTAGTRVVSTIEHLMSALSGCGIDNVIVEINGPEIPLMDGSSAPFVFLIECAGIATQGVSKKAIRVLKSVTVLEANRWVSLVPSDGFSIELQIDFDDPAISNQTYFFRMSAYLYKREISRARIFGFLRDVDKLRDMGFARGGSLDNCIVIDRGRVLNDGGLRYDNELVRHKVLDCIGDLYLAGGPLIGHFSGYRPGHALTLRLLNELFTKKDAWQIEEATQEPIINDPTNLPGNRLAISTNTA